MPWPAYRPASAFNPGCSLRQGPHHAAQKTRTLLDALKSTDSADPSSVSPESRGAAVPTRPLGAACEASGCKLQPASSKTRINQGPRPSKLIDRAGLGAAQGSLKPETGRRRPDGCRQQGLVQHFVDVLDENELHGTLDFFRHLVQVLAILLRQDEGLDSCPVRGQQFFLQPPNGQHLAP